MKIEEYSHSSPLLSAKKLFFYNDTFLSAFIPVSFGRTFLQSRSQIRDDIDTHQYLWWHNGSLKAICPFGCSDPPNTNFKQSDFSEEDKWKHEHNGYWLSKTGTLCQSQTGNGCGIYSTKIISTIVTMIIASPILSIASVHNVLIRNHGKIIVHETGLRASEAEIVGVIGEKEGIGNYPSFSYADAQHLIHCSWDAFEMNYGYRQEYLLRD